MKRRYELRGDVTKADLREIERLLAELWILRHEAKGERDRFNAARRYDAVKVVFDTFDPEAERGQ
ncbi:MAG: hypothetical protein BGO05_03875 [Rhizobiales bacterium 63-7]|nr:MAG: hypothetical protein BGO05_03875 [Rhizobiales bacterium 63-7]